MRRNPSASVYDVRIKCTITGSVSTLQRILYKKIQSLMRQEVKEENHRFTIDESFSSGSCSTVIQISIQRPSRLRAAATRRPEILDRLAKAFPELPGSHDKGWDATRIRLERNFFRVTPPPFHRSAGKIFKIRGRVACSTVEQQDFPSFSFFTCQLALSLRTP